MLTWPWDGALTTAEAAKCALAESRVFDVWSMEQVVCLTLGSGWVECLAAGVEVWASCCFCIWASCCWWSWYCSSVIAPMPFLVPAAMRMASLQSVDSLPDRLAWLWS